jgi:hypothetical protein
LAKDSTHCGHTGSLGGKGRGATAVWSRSDYRLWSLRDRQAANSPESRWPPILVLVINDGTEEISP